MSGKRAHGDTASSAALRLGLEADATLRDDPELLCDPRRLGALHARLAAALGAQQAEAILLEVGFLQGLRDGERAVVALNRSERGVAEAHAPRLAFAVSPLAQGEWHGAWRDGFEAQGRLAALGRAPGPACALSAGYTSGWLSALFGEDLLALETECGAAGGARCAFRARPAAAWAASRNRDARRVLAGLDFASLRASVAPEPAEEAEGQVDPALPVVHVWGPVMVVPFSGTEDSISALELIDHDRNAREVSVVVVDLGGAILDEGLGAFALERVIEAIEARGVDAVLAGVSPRSEPVVARLADPHLVVHGELPEAIATAFQIADARRRGAA